MVVTISRKACARPGVPPGRAGAGRLLMGGYDIGDGGERTRGTDRTARLCREVAIEARRALRLREGLDRKRRNAPCASAGGVLPAQVPGRQTDRPAASAPTSPVWPASFFSCSPGPALPSFCCSRSPAGVVGRTHDPCVGVGRSRSEWAAADQLGAAGLGSGPVLVNRDRRRARSLHPDRSGGRDGRGSGAGWRANRARSTLDLCSVSVNSDP